MELSRTAVRRGLGLAHRAFTFLVLAYIALLIVGIVYRHPVRYDLTVERRYSLSGETRTTLSLLEGPVDVIMVGGFLDNPVHRAMAEVYERGRALLREYRAKAPNLKILADIDLYGKDPTTWLDMQDRYQLQTPNPTQPYGRFLFVAGGRRQEVRVEDLAEMDRGQAGRVRVKQFHGEKVFTASLRRLMGEPRKAYFARSVADEPSINDDKSPYGLASLRDEMASQNYEVREFSIAREKKVPADADVLVIPGPVYPYDAPTVEALEAYLEGGGGALVAFNPQVGPRGLEAFLTEWGVQKEEAIVIRREAVLGRSQNLADIPVGGLNPAHPITSKFDPSALNMVFNPCVPLEPRQDAAEKKKLGIVPLLFTPKVDVWGETDLRMQPASEATYQEGRDLGPPLIMAMAVEAMRGKSDEGREGARGGRLVVLGSYFPMTKAGLQAYPSHRDLILNTLYWLQGREELVSIQPERYIRRQVALDAPVRRFLAWICFAILPGIALGVSLFAWWVRRR